jgi:hypothetical protein
MTAVAARALQNAMCVAGYTGTLPTCMAEAVRENDIDTVRALVALGVPCNTVAHDRIVDTRRIAMIPLVWGPNTPRAGILMRHAVHAQWYAGVAAMLDAGVSASVVSTCMTHAGPLDIPLLYCAIAYGTIDIMRLLLQRGADPNARVRSHSPTSFALHYGHNDAVVYLHCAGAEDTTPRFLRKHSRMRWCAIVNDSANMLRCAHAGDLIPAARHPLVKRLRMPWGPASPIHPAHATVLALVSLRLRRLRKGRTALPFLDAHLWHLITSLAVPQRIEIKSYK